MSKKVVRSGLDALMKSDVSPITMSAAPDLIKIVTQWIAMHNGIALWCGRS